MRKVRKREREREKEGERERELLFLFFKGMTGALAPFSYLVFNICNLELKFKLKKTQIEFLNWKKKIVTRVKLKTVIEKLN